MIIKSIVCLSVVLNLTSCNKNSSTRDPEIVAEKPVKVLYAVNESERKNKFDKVKELQKQVSQLENELLAPSKEDLAYYKEFLNQEKTGLVRLELNPLMYFKLSGGFCIKDTNCNYNRDILVGQNELIPGNSGADYGFVIEVPNQDIKEVSEISIEAAVAINEPSMDGQVESEWRKAQNKYNYSNAEAGGLVLKPRIKLDKSATGKTFIVRVVSSGKSDTVLALQIARIDNLDNTVVVAWKVIKELKVPEIAK